MSFNGPQGDKLVFKNCLRCGQSKSTNAFQKRSDTKDWFSNVCKICKNSENNLVERIIDSEYTTIGDK